MSKLLHPPTRYPLTRLKRRGTGSKPYTPKTSRLVERFNGWAQREVPGITLYGHQDLETLLSGFNVACNGRRQRVLKGRSPDVVLRAAEGET